MPVIETDNPIIEKELQNITDLVSEGGGGIHSNLLIQCHDGDLRVSTKDHMANGKELIRLSKGVLLPSDQYDVSLLGNEFNVSFPQTSALSTLQRKLAEGMINLYTLTNKASIQKSFSFQLNMGPYPKIMDKLCEARLINKNILDNRKKIENGLKGKELDTFLCDNFLHTRHLGYNDVEKSKSVPILMPVVDFFNHHWSGARFNVSKSIRPGDLIIGNSQPIPDNRECHAFYGVMDSLDSMLRYDFIDQYAPIVRSVPIELDLPNDKKIKVNSNTGAINLKKLTKDVADLDRYLPITDISTDKNTLKVSHLIIPTNSSQLALRRVLQSLLTKLLDEKDLKNLPKTWIFEAEQQIIEKNNTYYKELSELVEKTIKERENSSILQQLQDLCRIQTEKLKLYKPPVKQTAA